MDASYAPEFVFEMSCKHDMHHIMEGICVGKVIVIEIKFIFGLIRCKTMCNCVYSETAEKQEIFNNFIACDIANELTR